MLLPKLSFWSRGLLNPFHKDSENIRKVVEDIFSGAVGKEYGSDCIVDWGTVRPVRTLSAKSFWFPLAALFGR